MKPIIFFIFILRELNLLNKFSISIYISTNDYVNEVYCAIRRLFVLSIVIIPPIYRGKYFTDNYLKANMRKNSWPEVAFWWNIPIPRKKIPIPEKFRGWKSPDFQKSSIPSGKPNPQEKKPNPRNRNLKTWKIPKSPIPFINIPRNTKIIIYEINNHDIIYIINKVFNSVTCWYGETTWSNPNLCFTSHSSSQRCKGRIWNCSSRNWPWKQEKNWPHQH